jgi:hypothetical protein
MHRLRVAAQLPGQPHEQTVAFPGGDQAPPDDLPTTDHPGTNTDLGHPEQYRTNAIRDHPAPKPTPSRVDVDSNSPRTGDVRSRAGSAGTYRPLRQLKDADSSGARLRLDDSTTRLSSSKSELVEV